MKICLFSIRRMRFFTTAVQVRGKVSMIFLRLQSGAATSLTCKLTDFGVWLKGGGAWVYGSRPWQAPECSRPAFFKTEEAKRTDIYSFGMLLWRVALDGDPFNTLGELEGSTSKERRDNRNRKIASLKDSDGLVDHVYQSLASSDSFTRPQLEMLCEVVSVTLVKEPRQRELDVTRLIRLLSKDQWYEARHPVAPARIPVSIDSQFLDMEKWYHEFARISPVVHSLIVSGFLSTVHSPSSADEDTLTESRLYASYQLAVCYANGTGVSFSPKDCLKWLEFAANNGSEQARKAHSKIAESFALPPLVLTYPSADSPDSSNPNSPFEPISLTEASRETSASHINKGMNVNGDDLEPGKLQDHLLEAAEGCQYTTMSALISAGVKPGISQDGVTPLHFSSSWDISEAIKLIPQFTKAGSDINAAAKRGPTLGGTPLMWSVFEDCIEISRLLVENGANPLHCDDRGENALHVAARTHSASHLRMLLAHVRPVDVHTHFSKLVEVALGGTSRFARLVRHGKQSKANADEILGLLKDWSVFYSGPEFFVPVLISSLESSVACVYAAMNTDLQMTAIHAHKIEPSLLVNILNESILRFNKGLFNALLDYGVPVTTTFRFQKSLLHSCARIPDHSVAASEFAPRILAQGGNVHSRDENGLTPWMDAVLQRKWDLADLLLNEGSDAFATDNEGFNVLGLCIKNINAGSLGYVMKYNVQVKRSKEDFHKRCFMVNEKLGISALQLAASKRLPRAHGMKREVLGVFLHCLTDYSNDHSQLHHRSSGLLSDLLTDATALDIAATLGYVHIVKALVKNGAHHDGDGPRASRHAKAALERSSSLVDSQERMNLERCIFIIDNWDSDTTGTRKIADYWTSLKTLDESERRVSWAIIADHQDGP